MRIVYVSLSYLPTVAGGVQVLTHGMAKEMQLRGHEVEIVCAESVEDGDDAQVHSARTEYDGLVVHRLSYNRHRMPDYFRTFYDVPLVADCLVRLYQERKPDLFHVTHFSRLSTSVFMGIRRLGVPSLLTLADYSFLCPMGTLMRYDGRLCPGAEAVGGIKCLGCVVAETPTYQQHLLRFLFNPDQVARVLKLLNDQSGARRFLPTLYLNSPQVFEDRINHFRRLLPMINMYVTNNHWSREFYIDHGFPEDRTKCVVQTLDVSWSRGFVRTPYSGPLRIGFTGIVASHKGVHVLIQAFHLMKHRGKARLLIFGENKNHPLYLEKLESLAGGDEHIQFHGAYSPGDLKHLYDSMDVMVCPSMFYETGPLVILEAQAARTPVVASDLGPIRELVRHNVDGYLFERGDTTALAGILDHLCEHREELDRLQSQIRPVKTIAEMSDELEALYSEVISGQPT